jgi:hypothetical protein
LLEHLARWYLRKQIVDWQIARDAAWNEGYQMGYRVGIRDGCKN